MDASNRLLSLDGTAPPPSVQGRMLAAQRGVAHGFFGRQGGVSEGLYASLNTGFGSDDRAEAVGENRRRIAAALDVAPENLITAHQIHSADVVVVDAPPTNPPHGDALVTRTPGLLLGVLAADCGPVLLADAQAGVIGAAHAGWKGALAGVTDAAIAAMTELGARPAAITAAIGPCISQAEYEVGPEFIARFCEADPNNARFFHHGRGDRSHFDLKGYLAARLMAAGVTRIDVLGDCTCAQDTAYFSNRRRTRRGEPDYGRNLSVIALSGDGG